MNNIVSITADANDWRGDLKHNWNYIGYDECNYTHSPGGMALIRKFGRLEKPYYIRAHHMLCTGNCHGSYKWGSTNAYTEDENGDAVYNFSVIDRMCDIWLSNNCKPFFEIGFMPLDLADTRAAADKTGGKYEYNEYKHTGWNMPPKDYVKWGALIENLVGHLVRRYGADEISTWYFEMWNEPDIFYWKGSHDEFCKLYDYTEAAVHSALPEARFGGPATCGATEHGGRAAAYLKQFLIHCRDGKNYVTGKTGTRLDFTSFHTKGGGYRFTTDARLDAPPSVESFLRQVRVGCEIIKECGYGELECVLSEADPDGWAAGGRFDNPALDFRNTEHYASYVASGYKGIQDLADELGMDIKPLAWAFMFEGERCFEGTRTFSTQGINKAVFNLFIMFSMLGHQQVGLTISQNDGSRDKEGDRYSDSNWNDVDGVQPDGTAEECDAIIGGWAALTGEKQMQALLFSHEDAWGEGAINTVEFRVENLPFDGSCNVRHYRIDASHSNAYAEWARQGRPDFPAGSQYEAIKARDGLEPLHPEWTVALRGGRLSLRFDMPSKSVSLIIIEPVDE